MTPRRLSAFAFAFLALALDATAQTPPPVPAPPLTAAGPTDKAFALFNAGQYDEALKELQAAAKADPKLAPARVTLAGWLFQAKQGPAARQNLEAAAAEDPKHADVYLTNGLIALEEGRFTDSLLNCQAALALAAEPRWNPDQRRRIAREARLGLAASLSARRDFPAARDQLLAVLADDPKNGVARVRLGTSLFLMGKPDEALAEFQAARRDDPVAELPELQMVGLFNGQGAADKAEEWVKRAITAHPADAKPQRTYASWLLDQGKVPEAQAAIDAAARLDPKADELAPLQGLFARYRKDAAAAEAIFEALHKKSPANKFAAWNLALSLAESGDKDKLRRATELAESELRKNPRESEAHAVLGWCHYKAGNLDAAERALTAATQAGPLSRDAAYFLARVLADRQRYEECAKLLRAAAAAPGGQVYRADAQALLGEVERKLPPAKK